MSSSPSPQHHEADGDDLLEEGCQSVQPEQLLAFQPLYFIVWLYIHVLSCIYDNHEKCPECITLLIIQHSKKMKVADSITQMYYRTTHSASLSCELYVSTLGQLFDVNAPVLPPTSS